MSINYSVARALILCAAVASSISVCTAQVQLSVGEGEFTYVDGGGNAQRPVRVHYVYPEGFDSSYRPRVLFALHGSERDAVAQLERFRGYAQLHDTLLLCPEFSADHWPDERYYGRGNVRDEQGRIRPRSDWSFSTVREIFAQVVGIVPNAPEVYDCVGHSAGAQFVHRMALMMPDAPLGRLVAANAGWYQLPDDQARYPYGIENVAVSQADLAIAFGRELTVTLGTLDNDPSDPSLNQDAWARAQGSHRYARGQYFYDYCRQLAADRGLPFRWTVVDVPNVGHDSGGMAPAVAAQLFGPADLRVLPAADTYVVENSSVRHGADSDVRVDGDSLKIAYLRFDLSALAGVDVEFAALRVQVTDGSDALQVVRLVADNDWSENLNFAERPAVGDEVGAGFGGSAGLEAHIRLTDLVRAARGGVVSFAIESSTADGLSFHSRETANPPELVVWKARAGTSYGTGAAGAGGAAPQLEVPQLPRLGGRLDWELRGAAANATIGWVIGVERAAVAWSGVNLLVDPVALVFGATDGQGKAGASAAIPAAPSLDGMRVCGQVIVQDPAGLKGYAATRALEIVVRAAL